MKKYRCKICGKIIEIDDINNIEKCPICNADKSFLEEIKNEKIEGPIPMTEDNPAIMRIEEKCIKCGLCSKICQNKVGISYDPKKAKSAVCLNCGQCLLNCPVGAIVPKYCYKKVFDYIKDTDKIVICYVAPAVRVALGDEFEIESGTNVDKKMVTALKKLGFNYVFDVTFGADLTIMEEASELIDKIKNKKKLPQFTSCCPSWVKYAEIYHPEILDNLSTCKSPIAMQGSMVKNYFASMMQIDKENIITVAITPCTAKKYEIEKPDIKDTDYVITTTELAMLLRENEISLVDLEDTEFDKIMTTGSGGGVIFGSSGGVAESALRCAHYFITKKDPTDNFLEYNDLRGYEEVKEASVTIDGIKLNVLVCYGMKNIEKLISSGDYKKYDFIEVMNCPGGCIGGGGQPLKIISKQKEIIELRSKELYNIDKNLDVRYCYKNQDIIDIYNSYLEHPLSNKSEELLHTKYEDKSSILGE